MALAKPWLLVEDGVLVNLNFIIKVVRVDTVAPTYGIVFFHSSSGTGSSQKVLYVDAETADAKFAQIQALINANAEFEDLT
jgi:hypothetical protein